MTLGLRTALVLTAGGALAGCLTSNPNLEESEGSAEDGSTAATDPTAGPTTVATSTSAPTTGSSTSAGPTTVDPDTTGTTGPTSDTEDTTGPAQCGGGNICVEEAPAGWAGPVVWAETLTTDDPPECPAAYPELAFEAFDDLQAAPAECDCDCGSASGASCAPIVLEYHGTDSTCFSPNEEFTMTAACSSGPSGFSGDYWEVEDPGVSGGSCSPSGTTDLPVAGWNSASTVCGGVEAMSGVCGGGDSCVPGPPEGFEARACIWQAGDLQCPNGEFSDRFVRHAAVTDSRNCQTCTCGAPEGECVASLTLRNSCSGGGAGNLDIGDGCTRINAGVGGANYTGGSLSVTNVSCEPSVGTAIGEAEPDDPYTLCCQTIE